MKKFNLKEKAEKVEEFIEDHYGTIMLGGMMVFGVALGVAVDKRNKKFLDNVAQDNRMYLMASLASQSKKGD